MARRENTFHDVSQIIPQIFQGEAIDRVISLRTNFAAGRVVEETTGRTLWFLERRRPANPLVTRRPQPGYRVDYPFEPASDAHAG